MVNLRACDSGACSAASNLSTASPATAGGSVRLNGAAAPPLPLLFSGWRIWSCGRILRVEGEPRRMSRPKAQGPARSVMHWSCASWQSQCQWHAAGQALAGAPLGELWTRGRRKQVGCCRLVARADSSRSFVCEMRSREASRVSCRSHRATATISLARWSPTLNALGDEGTTDDRQPWSHHAVPPVGRLDRHAGRHEQTYESRVRAGRHPPGRGNSLTRL
jgi:hypothetical protein